MKQSGLAFLTSGIQWCDFAPAPDAFCDDTRRQLACTRERIDRSELSILGAHIGCAVPSSFCLQFTRTGGAQASRAVMLHCIISYNTFAAGASFSCIASCCPGHGHGSCTSIDFRNDFSSFHLSPSRTLSCLRTLPQPQTPLPFLPVPFSALFLPIYCQR